MLTFVHMSVGGFMSGFTCVWFVCVTGRKCSRGLGPAHVWGGGCRVVLWCCSIGMYSLKKKAWP